MYGGVICGACHKLECRVCKSARGHVDAPCSWCGSAVSPAFEHLLGGGFVPISWDRPQASVTRPPAKPLKKSTVLLVVFGVVAIIAAVAFPNLNRAQERSRYAKTVRSLRDIEADIGTARMMAGETAGPIRDVSDFNELAAFLETHGFKEIPRFDAWGRPFTFERRGDGYILVSYGSNGRKDFVDPFTEPALPISKGGDVVSSNGFLVHAPEEFRR